MKTIFSITFKKKDGTISSKEFIYDTSECEWNPAGEFATEEIQFINDLLKMEDITEVINAYSYSDDVEEEE